MAKVPGVTSVVSPYSADGARQVARGGDIAYATVQFDKQASKIPDSTIEHIRTLKDDAVGGGVKIALGGRMFQEPGGIGPAELIGILAAIVILLVAFGSLLARVRITACSGLSCSRSSASASGSASCSC